MIKLVVSDVDGTLVKDGTLEINPEYMDVIKKLRKKKSLLCSMLGQTVQQRKPAFCAGKRPDLFCIRRRDTDPYFRKNTEDPYTAGRDLEEPGQNG